MTLLDLVKTYQTLLEQRDALTAEIKAINTDLEALKARIIQQMIDDDCPRVTAGGYSFRPAAKTAYTKRSDRELTEKRLDFRRVLRAEGLGYVITETADPGALQTALQRYAEEHGGLSLALAAVVRAYEYEDVVRRKVMKKRINNKEEN